MRLVIKVIRNLKAEWKHNSLRLSARGRDDEGRGQEPGGLTLAGPPSGGPVRSFRNNHVHYRKILPISPSDLEFQYLLRLTRSRPR